jgi:hypothetical protein
MPPPPERRWPGIVTGYAVLVGLLLLAGTPAYFYADSSAKPLVVRLAVGVVLAVALFHVRGEILARIRPDAPSRFERARRLPRPEPELAPLFVKLRDALWFSRASQGYFEHILWPQLVALIAGRAGQASLRGRPRPAWRRLLGRGPSLAALRTLITRIEERP